MRAVTILSLLGAIIVVNASYRATESPEQWRQRFLKSQSEDPSWLRFPTPPSRLPPLYVETEKQIRDRALAYREKYEKEHPRPTVAADSDIDVEKRRNLLVGRYGFRIGKRFVGDQNDSP